MGQDRQDGESSSADDGANARRAKFGELPALVAPDGLIETVDTSPTFDEPEELRQRRERQWWYGG